MRKNKKKRLSRKQFYRKKRIKAIIKLSFVMLIIVTILSFGFTGSFYILDFIGFEGAKNVDSIDIKKMYLTPNEYSRPQTKLKRVKGIVVHYTANPGTTAEDNRNYFEGLSESHVTYASSHFVIGIKGEIVQCLPLNEMSYASNSRNDDTISIECCHQDASGKFTKETYDSLVNLTAWLCNKYHVPKKNVIRHYDITGKICPKYFVDHEDAWIKFKNEVFTK
ncbi:peptidoglycan recognition protein family protein [Anaeromicropila herbilytica]|uniref:N-acetylmuramoyl-L-alanine amidase n=1 Tax=Anaeromicropila herbilytica TaxID=2785025 RepID=A0A7R7IE29_9FIRM|nr:peptidoglycan recognition family protein [Anaeromicropila herbilytica]BCN32328.1 hypothetical protein bsdtb5_36230 [Anaeromicropila herbilytica]